MKPSELKQLIREEINNMLNEETPKNKIVAQWMGPDFFLAKKEEKDWDDKDYDLFYKLEKMASTGKVPKLNEDIGHYMFFENLKIIKQMVDEMLELDEQMVDGILASGHDWAADHIATSKDDISEVHNFLMTKEAPIEIEEKELSAKQQKIAKAAPPENKITAADFAALRAGK
jgi:hypothetical protein